MNYTQPADIDALYRELFGRAPDQQGFNYWQTQAPSLIDQGGTNKLREAMIGGASPTDADYYGNRNVSEADWAAYSQRAGDQMTGLNNMPGVFSDYGALAGATPEAAQSMMYHDKDSLQNIMKDFMSLYGVGNIEALGGVDGSAQANQSGSGVLRSKGK